MVVEIIEYVLRDCGFNTFDIASTSDEAIAAAGRRCPDLITADVNLTTGNGIGAIRTICPKSSTPVIIITGWPAAEVRAQISEHAVLHKPFSEQTLTYPVLASMSAKTRFPQSAHLVEGGREKCHWPTGIEDDIHQLLASGAGRGGS